MEYEDELRAFRQEFLDAGDNMPGAGSLRGMEIADWIEVHELARRRETLPHPEMPVMQQFALLRENDNRVVGMINIREMNEWYAEYGGHIGYCVRPSERRCGYATIMLRRALALCPEFGIDRALVLCHASNIASRKTILANGGVFERVTRDEGEDEASERYWICTGD
jgi:predicted acetyltransferase